MKGKTKGDKSFVSYLYIILYLKIVCGQNVNYARLYKILNVRMNECVYWKTFHKFSMIIELRSINRLNK